MLAVSHKFTFGLCVSVIALTAVVVASITLMLYKQQDNALLLQHINTLKTENAALREQLHQFTAAQDTPHRNLVQPATVDSSPVNSGPAPGS